MEKIQKIYYITLDGVLIAKGLSEENLDVFKRTTTYNFKFVNRRGSISSRDMPTVIIHEDEVVEYYYDDVLDDYGWCWHEVVKSLSGEVYLDKFGGGWTNPDPNALSNKPILRGKVEVLGL